MDSRRVYRAHSDEQAWYPVVRLILSTICEHRLASFLEVDSQSKSEAAKEFVEQEKALELDGKLFQAQCIYFYELSFDTLIPNMS